MISDEDIKQIFFYCDHRDPNGSYADGVDILEFGKKVAAVAEVQGMKAEREKCVTFIAQTNPELAESLKNLFI